MRVFFRFLTIAITTLTLRPWMKPPHASAEGCPCTTNSKIVNTFPVRSLRWGTGRVIQGTSECDIRHIVYPRVAITKLHDVDLPGALRGYQLVVVDEHNQTRCQGSQLTGVVFDQLYTRHDEPVVIRQVAKAKVTPNSVPKGACLLDEYRLVYMITPANRPEDSVCTHELHNGRLRRFFRRFRRYRILEFPSPEVSSSPAELLEIPSDRLVDYAVIIPDADYDTAGNPHHSSSQGLLAIPKEYKDLEWYELACADGALAHTDLKGLVELGEGKDMRTAAMRMLQAKYKNNQTQTITGVPISFRRDKPYSQKYQDLCKSSASSSPSIITAIITAGLRILGMIVPGFNALIEPEVIEPEVRDIEPRNIEAQWNTEGAVCVSHARLWMRDSLNYNAQAYPGLTLEAREQQFLTHLGLAPCTPDSLNHPTPGIYFTSGVVQHITHPNPPQAQAPHLALPVIGIKDP